MRTILMLLLSVCVAQASLITSSCSRNFPIKTVTTDASVTPTGNQVTVTAGMNGIRVWTGEQTITEAFFYLYVSRNGGASVKVKVFRWQGRIITASSGDVISLGTVDGRTLKVTPMWTPATTESASGVSGTANCDNAGPPIWSPSAAHIILPSNSRCFSIAPTGAPLNVFVSEFDGNNWTPTRWLLLETNRTATVRTSYRQIALATYGGTTLSVSAAPGSIIGGTSAKSHLAFATMSGTSRSCANLAQFKTALGAAVAGDEIVLDDGTYVLDINVSAATFAANITAGNVGMEGITIRSASGNRDACIISCSAPTTGQWVIDETGATLVAGFRDLTFDFTSANTTHQMNKGKWAYENVRIHGPESASSQQLMMHNCDTGTSCDMLRCMVDHAYEDGLVMNYPGGIPRIIDCTVTNGGASLAAQCYTQHSGSTAGVYGGWFSDSSLNVIANGANTDKAVCFFLKITAGGRLAGIHDVHAFGCDFSEDTSDFIPNNGGYVMFTRIWDHVINKTSATVEPYVLEGNIHGGNASSYGYFPYGGGSSMRWSVFQRARLANYNGASGAPVYMANNTMVQFGNDNIYAVDATLVIDLQNLASTNSNASVNTDATTYGHMTGHDYNVFKLVYPAYTGGAHDTIGSFANLTTNLMPTASGNCDGNGNAALYDWVGGSDFAGLPVIYKSTRVSRGAREIPAVYSGAELYPDIW